MKTGTHWKRKVEIKGLYQACRRSLYNKEETCTHWKSSDTEISVNMEEIMATVLEIANNAFILFGV